MIRKDNCAGDGIDVESGKGKNKVTVGEGMTGILRMIITTWMACLGRLR